MHPFLAISIVTALVSYFALQFLLKSTQSSREPCLTNTAIPFFDSAIGILRHKVNYLTHLKNKHQLPVCTLRMPFQRLYVVHEPRLIQTVQNKNNAKVLIPNLLDFGMLFSGLNRESRSILGSAFEAHGNSFTKSVHEHLLSGPSLCNVTRAAIDRLSASLSVRSAESCEGLLEFVRHELTLALTGAIYGPSNPFDNVAVENSWKDFVPGISHLLYSPIPSMTARKALNARSRVVDAFRDYFKNDGHLQAFPMISEMYKRNMSHGLHSREAAKMEMATSLAMLSSGAITAFWLLFQVLSNNDALTAMRAEIDAMAKREAPQGDADTAVLDLSTLKSRCPTLMAMLNETLRYHSTVINIKQVRHDTILADQYLLKKQGIVMIPGQSVHHDKQIWGDNADQFDHRRFMDNANKKHLASTSAFRPFGAGATMCPGRYFSTNVILGLVAMILVQFDVSAEEAEWTSPTKHNADMWNAMPKPDWDVKVRLVPRQTEHVPVVWKFTWADNAS
ncbi:hypothetical protein ACN47E_000587 [Coniothyrium glycines]